MIHRTKMPNLVCNLRESETLERRSSVYFLHIHIQISHRNSALEVIYSGLG